MSTSRFKLTRQQLQAHFVQVRLYVMVSLKVHKSGVIKEVGKSRITHKRLQSRRFELSPSLKVNG